MKKVILILGSAITLLGACTPLDVRITGNIQGLEGTVKLLAEIPGKGGFVVLAQQNVKNGNIDLRAEQLVPPAQVWIDLKGRKIIELIIDARKGTFIKGQADSLDHLEITGSALMTEYKRTVQTLDERFNPEKEGHEAKIIEISQKKTLTRDDEVRLGMLQAARLRLIGRRADYVKLLVRKNPGQELSLFLLKNELADSLNAQKKLFATLAIRDKESNIYKILENQLR
ncbi:MAG: hypothetical protein LBF09_06170 [Odoribacteraceae bacterium]|jgi:hypothetical protein|nr:hypothetical protein [Odoribacteraceae bacterium]